MTVTLYTMVQLPGPSVPILTCHLHWFTCKRHRMFQTTTVDRAQDYMQYNQLTLQACHSNSVYDTSREITEICSTTLIQESDSRQQTLYAKGDGEFLALKLCAKCSNPSLVCCWFTKLTHNCCLHSLTSVIFKDTPKIKVIRQSVWPRPYTPYHTNETGHTWVRI